ncbi:MAG: ATP-binding protein, partial [Desulfatirhabdiaceae bacterium]
LLGCPRKEIEGKMKLNDFITDENFRMSSRFHRARRQEDRDVPAEYEAQLTNKRGEKKIIFFRVGMIPETRNSIASLIDITDKKQMEMQLHQAHKMQAIGTLAGGIAHDFNNILAGIMGYAQMALHEIENASSPAKRLEHILSTCDRARELIRQILTFSHPGENRIEPVRLDRILEETIRLIRATAPAWVTINSRSAAATEPVMADSSQIHQVILNLCTNAIQSMSGDRGPLSASLATVVLNDSSARHFPSLKAGKYVHLTIRDTGRGMSPEVVERIFDPFFTTKKPGEGTGMGLSVVHGIVKHHHGTIQVHSEPGKGSTFEVFFPSADNQTGQSLEHCPDHRWIDTGTCEDERMAA